MIKYLTFLIKSTNKHGVHSPFVFDLVTQCFNIKTSIYKKKEFRKHKRELLKNKDSGYQISNKKANLLIRIVNYFKPEQVLEIGMSTDLENSAIQIGSPKSIISTIKISKEKVENKTYDFIYFGRNQKEKEVLNYFETCLKHKNNNSIFVFNNIHSSKEMSRVWTTIKKHSEVSVTIDTYYFGMVFFRQEQAKEHFVVRV